MKNSPDSTPCPPTPPPNTSCARCMCVLAPPPAGSSHGAAARWWGGGRGAAVPHLHRRMFQSQLTKARIKTASIKPGGGGAKTIPASGASVPLTCPLCPRPPQHRSRGVVSFVPSFSPLQHGNKHLCLNGFSAQPDAVKEAWVGGGD